MRSPLTTLSPSATATFTTVACIGDFTALPEAATAGPPLPRRFGAGAFDTAPADGSRRVGSDTDTRLPSTSTTTSVAPAGSASPMLVSGETIAVPKVSAGPVVTVPLSFLPDTYDPDSYQSQGYGTELAALTLPSAYFVDPLGNIALDTDVVGGSDARLRQVVGQPVGVRVQLGVGQADDAVRAGGDQGRTIPDHIGEPLEQVGVVELHGVPPPVAQGRSDPTTHIA